MRNYVVIAYNYEQYMQWCRDKKINPSGENIKFFWAGESVRGIEEYEIIFLERWYENSFCKKDPELINSIAQKAFRVRHEWEDEPIVSGKGEIAGWTTNFTTTKK